MRQQIHAHDAKHSRQRHKKLEFALATSFVKLGIDRCVVRTTSSTCHYFSLIIVQKSVNEIVSLD